MRLAVALTLALSLLSCAKNPSPVQEGDVILKAKMAAVALGTLQHSAIELNKIETCNSATPPVCSPVLSEANTGIVVDAVTDALTTMKSVPSGWRATVDSALARVVMRLDEAGKTQLSRYIEAAKLVLGGL